MKSFALALILAAMLTTAATGICRAATASSASIHLTLDAHPDNTLMADAFVTVTPDAEISVEFEAAGLTARTTTRTESGGSHLITVVGMRAETTYTMTAVARFDDGSVLRSDSVDFQTGALPDGAPQITVTTDTGQGLGGITLFGKTGSPEDNQGPVYFGADEAGEIVWYLPDGTTASPVIRRISAGKWMVFYDGSIALITPAGETLQTWNLSNIGRFHHDAVLLPSGNLLVLDSDTASVNGQTLSVDLICEITPEGTLVWSWSTLDHLDTERFPSSLATSSERGGSLDWSHCNALHYIPEEDAILLSSRSQSWVIKIDHATSDLVWILGGDQDVSEGFDARFFTLTSGTWMTAQHAATVTSDGQILLYDNRNDSDGRTLNSRAVKYTLDESSWTAAQTWESVMSVYTLSYGDVDELSNGNILICAGGPGGGSSLAYIREAGPDGETVWEMAIDTRLYRAERVSWDDLTETPASSEADACTGLALSPLPGFDRDYYLAAKLASIQAASEDWAGKTTADLEALFTTLGYTAQDHYDRYGYTEGLNPNAYFDRETYIANKARAMVDSGQYADVDAARIAFLNAWPGDVYRHYLSYGAAEGLNPSALFDETAYLSDKLAALKADPDTSGAWTGKSVDDLRRYLSELTLTALTHYLYHGVCEGLSPSSVN